MRPYSSKEIIKLLESVGWFEVNQEGSHKQFKHATMPGKVTVQHPRREIPHRTARSIFKQAGLEPPKEG